MNWTRKVAAVAALMAMLWFVAPTTLGGQTSYASTHGISMEPMFQAGDLALLRPAESYQIGDVVLYWSESMQTDVMHRIVDAKDGRFILQGDNNNWLDPEQPTEDEIIGELVLRIPQGGVWLKNLTSPPMLALFTFGLLATGSGTATRRNRRKARMSKHTNTTGASPILGTLPTSLRVLTGGAVVLAGLGSVLAAAAWTGPLDAPSTEQSAIGGAKMAFSYTADVGSSAAYDGTTANSPDPIFRKVADTVDVHYVYQGEPGTISVAAELSTPSGWRSTVAIDDAEAFTSNRYEGTVQLDLQELENRAQDAAKVTGMSSETVSIALTPHVVTADSDFKPTLDLQLTPLQLTLAAGPESLTVTDNAAAPAGEPRMTPRTIGTDTLNVEAEMARWISAGMLFVAAILGALTFVLARKVEPMSESAAIHRRHKALLVPAEPMSFEKAAIDLPSFEALAKLAERYSALILHWSRSGVETFVVLDESATYRYRIGASAGEQLAPLVRADA